MNLTFESNKTSEQDTEMLVESDNDAFDVSFELNPTF